MSSLTTKEQYVRVVYLAISFMIMFTAFNSLQNIVSKLYDQYQYYNLGQTAILFLYSAFGITTFFSSYIIKFLGFKKSMFFSSFGYAIFQATGILIAAQVSLPTTLIWIIVIAGGVLCGMGASILWVSQAGYVNKVASENRKNQLFGLFWGIMMSSQIFGNLLTTFILGKMSNLVYFILLSVLGFLSTLFFLFLPSSNNSQSSQEENDVNVKEQIQKIFSIIKNKKYVSLHLYYLLPGFAITFYAGFLYKLVSRSLPQDEGQSDDDYHKRVSFCDGLVFIALGVSQLLNGLLMNRFAELFSKFKLAIFGSLIVEVAGFISLICLFTSSFPLCFVCAFLWGISDNFLQTNTSAMIGILFPNKIQAYSVYRIFFAFGVTFTLVLTIALSNAPDWIFVIIILGMQTIVTQLAANLSDLQPEPDPSQKKSLMSDS